jgi:hypothetical protein
MASDADELIDPQDRAYVASLADARQRDVVTRTLLRYRTPERLAAGDPLPAVPAIRLDPARRVSLDRLVDGRPAVFVFGSYT